MRAPRWLERVKARTVAATSWQHSQGHARPQRQASTPLPPPSIASGWSTASCGSTSPDGHGHRPCLPSHGVYRCPRCNAPYCSAVCYKQHGDNCTESFYRESATQQLRATRATPADKQHMLEVLQRLHLQEQQQQPLPGDPLGLGFPPDHPHSSGSSGQGAAGAPEWEEGDEEEEEEEDEQQRAWMTAEAAKLGISVEVLEQILEQAEEEGEDWEPPEDLLPPHARAAFLVAAGQAPEPTPGTTQQQQQQQRQLASSAHSAGAQPRDPEGAILGSAEVLLSTSNSTSSSGGHAANPSWADSRSRREPATTNSRGAHNSSSSGGDGDGWQPWWTTAAAAELQLGPSGLPLVQEVPPSSTAAGTVKGFTQSNGAAAGVADSSSGSSSSRQGEAVTSRDLPLPPTPTTPIPSLSTLTKVPPSPLIAWQLLQLLFSYCLLYRQVHGQLLPGDWSNLQRLLVLAPHLLPPGGANMGNSKAASNRGRDDSSTSKQTCNKVRTAAAAAAADLGDAPEGLPPPESAAMALHQVMASCHTPEAHLPGGTSRRQTAALTALADAGVVLQLGRSCVLLVLHQLLTWVDRSREAMKAVQQQQKRQPTAAAPKGSGSGTFTPAAAAVPCGPAAVTTHDGMTAPQLLPGAVGQLSRQVKAAGHKLRYLLAWANEASEQLYQQLAVAAAAEHQQLQGSMQPVVSGVVLPGITGVTQARINGSSVLSSGTKPVGPQATAAAPQSSGNPLVVSLDSSCGARDRSGGGPGEVPGDPPSALPTTEADAVGNCQQERMLALKASPAAAAAVPGRGSVGMASGGGPSGVEGPTESAVALPVQPYAVFVEDMDALD